MSNVHSFWENTKQIRARVSLPCESAWHLIGRRLLQIWRMYLKTTLQLNISKHARILNPIPVKSICNFCRFIIFGRTPSFQKNLTNNHCGWILFIDGKAMQRTHRNECGRTRSSDNCKLFCHFPYWFTKLLTEMQVVYTMAEFPYPGLEELREKYTWNIHPLSTTLNLLRRSVTSALYDDTSACESSCSPCKSHDYLQMKI